MMSLHLMKDNPRLASYIDKVAPPGSDLSYALLFAGDSRDAIGALHAVGAEIAACTQQATEPDPGKIKLQWWIEEIDRFANHEQRHPLMLALAGNAQAAIGPEPLHAMVRNAAAVLSEFAPESPQEIVKHYRQQAAPLYEAIAALKGVVAPAAAPLGGAVMLVDEARVLCAKHTRFKAAGGDFDVATLMQAAAEEIDSATGSINAQERAPLRTLIVQAGLAQRWLKGAAKHDSYDSPALSPINKLWTAWRAARASV